MSLTLPGTGPLTIPSGSTVGASPAPGDSSLQVAPTAFVQNAILTQGFNGQLLYVRDEKASGTDGGGFTAGSYLTRTMNTVKNNEITGASLSSNQVTLPAGTYYVQASAPAFAVTQNKTKLRNITDSTDIIIGTNTFSSSSTSTAVRSEVNGKFTIAATKVIELQHRCTTTRATDGFGTNCGYGDVEVYAELRIWKIG